MPWYLDLCQILLTLVRFWETCGEPWTGTGTVNISIQMEEGVYLCRWHCLLNMFNAVFNRAGVRLVLHDPKVPPLTEEYGLDLAPNTASSVSVQMVSKRQHSLNRVSSYLWCTNRKKSPGFRTHINQTAQMIGTWLDTHFLLIMRRRYTLYRFAYFPSIHDFAKHYFDIIFIQLCQRYCYQKKIQEECGCFYPFMRQIETNSTGEVLTPCDITPNITGKFKFKVSVSTKR